MKESDERYKEKTERNEGLLRNKGNDPRTINPEMKKYKLFPHVKKLQTTSGMPGAYRFHNFIKLAPGRNERTYILIFPLPYS